MNNFLVTGSTGLVGRTLHEYVGDNPNWHWVSSINYDLRNYNEVCDMIALYKPDCLIHLAADVGGIFKNMEQSLDMFENNLMMNFNIIKASRINKIKKVIVFSSTCSFPSKDTVMDESDIHDGTPHETNFGYAYSKRILDVHANMSARAGDSKFITLIPTNIYGRYDHFNIKTSHVIPALITKARTESNVIVRGTGKALRQFIHADDVAKITHWFATEYNESGSFILATDEPEISIKELVNMIQMKINSQFTFDMDPTCDGQYKKMVTNARLKSVINYRFKPLTEGLDELIGSIKQL